MTLLTNMPAYIAGDAGAFSKGGSGFKKKKKKGSAQDTSYRIKQIIQHKKTIMASKKNMMRELLQKSD